MPKKYYLSLVACIFTIQAAVLTSEQAVTPKEAAAEVVPAPAEPIPVTEVETLKKHIGQEISVTGIPNAKSTIARSGHLFLNFDNTEFVVFCFGRDVGAFPDDKKPAALIGKTVKVTGKLALYKEKVQIAISKAEQIEVIAATEPAAPEEKPAEEKADESEKQ
jgi:DNA/RNA endonuclease YhcR with UshA esterase domain